MDLPSTDMQVNKTMRVDKEMEAHKYERELTWQPSASAMRIKRYEERKYEYEQMWIEP